jgi:hypothetical protein
MAVQDGSLSGGRKDGIDEKHALLHSRNSMGSIFSLRQVTRIRKLAQLYTQNYSTLSQCFLA